MPYPEEDYVQEWLFSQSDLYGVQFVDADNQWTFLAKKLDIKTEDNWYFPSVPILSTKEKAFLLAIREGQLNPEVPYRIVKVCRTLVNSKFIVFEVVKTR